MAGGPVPALAGTPAPRGHRERTAADTGGPSRRLVVGAIAGALAGGALVGLVVGVLAPPTPPTPTTVNLAAGATASSTTAAAAAAPRRSAGPTPSGSVTVTTIQATEITPPSDRIENPASDPNLRLVRVDDVYRDDQGRTMLKLTPLGKSGGKQFEAKLRDDAAIFGEFYIGDWSNVAPNRFGIDEARQKLRDALDQGKKPTAWIMRKFVAEGSVIYLSEQAPPENQR